MEKLLAGHQLRVLLWLVLKLSDQLDVEPEKTVANLAIFLKSWLETHIKTHDFKYRDYFKQKGLIK